MIIIYQYLIVMIPDTGDFPPYNSFYMLLQLCIACVLPALRHTSNKREHSARHGFMEPCQIQLDEFINAS